MATLLDKGDNDEHILYLRRTGRAGALTSVGRGERRAQA